MLSKAEEQFANELGQKLHRVTRQCEEHSSILRQDPNKYAEAYIEYAARNPAAHGFTPSPEDRDTCIAECERIFETPCKNLVDHFQAFSAGLFLLRIYKQGLSSQVSSHARIVQTKLHKANPLPVDTTGLLGLNFAKGEAPHPLFLQELTVDNKPLPPKRDVPIRTPPFINVEETEFFSWDKVPESRGHIVESVHLDAWKCNETGLYDLVFTTTVDEKYEAFMVISIMSTRKLEKTFYVLFVDESEAYAYSYDGLTELLLGAEMKGKLKH